MRSPFKEVLIGTALGLMVTLAIAGVDITPLVVLSGIAVAFKLMADGRLGQNQLETVSKVAKNSPPTTFADIGGQEVAKRELMEALEFVTDAAKCRALGIRPIKGILLTGPPGTGKTLLAKAAANYTNSTFIAASGSNFVEMYAGVGASRVRQLFQRAKEQAKKQGLASAIIFIDEIEVLGGKRGSNSSHLEYDQTLNQLLVCMDGINSEDEVRILVIAATNRADLMDDALLRPGRFDRIVKVDLPDKAARKHILQIHARGKPLSPEVSLDDIAAETFGFSGAHLESLLNEAAIGAMRRNMEVITAEHIKDAIEKVMLGEKLPRRPRPSELKRIAHHEIGHALISELLQPGSVSSVTITSRGSALGYMRQNPQDDRYLYTEGELENQIAIALAGAAAEELFFGSKSTGSVGDFEQATQIAKRMVLSGMSPLGIVSPRDLSGQELQNNIGKIVTQQYQRVVDLLRENEAVAQRLAAQLQAQERLDGSEIAEALAGKAA
ncbi:MAG: AAA family ATPase [Firmicutes bacterium]|nr:AAA family ATPase [Bacillota bacterium]